MKNETGAEPTFKMKTSVAEDPTLRELFLDGSRAIYWAENDVNYRAAEEA